MKVRVGDIVYIKGNTSYDYKDKDYQYEIISFNRMKCIKSPHGTDSSMIYIINPIWEFIIIKKGDRASHPQTNLFK